MKWILILCLVTGISQAGLLAQPDATQPGAALTAGEHIRALSEGTLLVRLPSNRAKIRALETSLENDALPDKSRSRIEHMLMTTKQETGEMQRHYAHAFDTQFNFCDVGFFYDYDTPAVLEGWGKVYHHDLETEIEVDLSRPRYILSIGRTPESRVSGLVVLDHKLDALPRPFPGSVITSGIMAMGSWFYSGPSQDFFVRKLQNNLSRYYQRQQHRDQ